MHRIIDSIHVSSVRQRNSRLRHIAIFRSHHLFNTNSLNTSIFIFGLSILSQRENTEPQTTFGTRLAFYFNTWFIFIRYNYIAGAVSVSTLCPQSRDRTFAYLNTNLTANTNSDVREHETMNLWSKKKQKTSWNESVKHSVSIVQPFAQHVLHRAHMKRNDNCSIVMRFAISFYQFRSRITNSKL